MRKLKNFSLVRKTTKFYSENEGSQISLYIYGSGKRIRTLFSGKFNPLLKFINFRELISVGGSKKNESDYQNQQLDGIRKNQEEYLLKKLKMGNIPVIDKDMPKFSIGIHGIFYFSPRNSCKRFLQSRDMNTYYVQKSHLNNSQSLIPYELKPDFKTICPKTTTGNEIMKCLVMKEYLQYCEQLLDDKKSWTLTMNLSEILDENKNEQVSTRKNVGLYDAFRKNSSCLSAMVENGDLNLLVLCYRLNSYKLEKSFDSSLEKNWSESIEKLLHKSESKNKLLATLKGTSVSQNYRNKNENITRRSILVMQSKLSEAIRTQANFNKIIKPRDINVENKNLGNFNDNRKQSEGPIIETVENFNSSKKQIVQTYDFNKCNKPFHLNGSMFNELNTNDVNKISKRKYTSRRSEEIETLIRSPTRKTSNKLKPLRFDRKEYEEYEDIELKNIIAAVAEKKRLDYVERSRMCWKVYREFEETMQLAKILNFPPVARIKYKSKTNTVNFNERKSKSNLIELEDSTTKLKNISVDRRKIVKERKNKMEMKSVKRNEYGTNNPNMKINKNDVSTVNTDFGKKKKSLKKKNSLLKNTENSSRRCQRKKKEPSLGTPYEFVDTKFTEPKMVKEGISSSVEKKSEKKDHTFSPNKGVKNTKSRIPVLGTPKFIAKQIKKIAETLASKEIEEQSGQSQTIRGENTLQNKEMKIEKSADESLIENLDKKISYEKPKKNSSLEKNETITKHPISSYDKTNQKLTNQIHKNEIKSKPMNKDQHEKQEKIALENEIFKKYIAEAPKKIREGENVNEVHKKKCNNNTDVQSVKGSDEKNKIESQTGITNVTKQNEMQSNDLQRSFAHTESNERKKSQPEMQPNETSIFELSENEITYTNIMKKKQSYENKNQREGGKENENIFLKSNELEGDRKIESDKKREYGEDNRKTTGTKSEQRSSINTLSHSESKEEMENHMNEKLRSKIDHQLEKPTQEKESFLQHLMKFRESEKNSENIKNELIGEKDKFSTQETSETFKVIAPKSDEVKKKDTVSEKELKGTNVEGKGCSTSRVQVENPTMTEQEITRKKRLIYFAEKIKINSESNLKESNKVNPSHSRKTEMENLQNKKKFKDETKASAEKSSSLKEEKESKKIILPLPKSEKQDLPPETQNIKNHELLRKTVSDSVIIKQASRKDSIDTVKGTPSITKSFLKKIQRQLNSIMGRSTARLKNQTIQKYRGIAVKLKKSQENFLRDVPSNVHKAISKTNLVIKKSQELIVKLRNFDWNREESKGIKKVTQKMENRVHSAIEPKVSTKMKMLGKVPSNRLKTQKKKASKLRIDDEKHSVSAKKKPNEDVSPVLSTSDMQNRSTGSLFADTVASAFAKCGNYDKIVSKYSDSRHNSFNSKFEGFERNESLLDSSASVRQVLPSKEDEYIMSDGVRKLVLNVTLKKKQVGTSDNEWNCTTTAVLKKMDENSTEHNERNKHKHSNDRIDTKREVKSGNSIAFLNTDEGRSVTKDNAQQMSCLNTRKNEFEGKEKSSNEEIEMDLLEKTKENLINLKKIIQSERNTVGYSQSSDNSEEIVMIKNNEISFIDQEKDVSGEIKSLEDLHKDFKKDLICRTAEGSTLPSPRPLETLPYTEKSTLKNVEIHPCNNAGETEKSEAKGKDKLQSYTNSPKNSETWDLKLTSKNIKKEKITEVYFTPPSSKTDLSKKTGISENELDERYKIYGKDDFFLGERGKDSKVPIDSDTIKMKNLLKRREIMEDPYKFKHHLKSVMSRKNEKNANGENLKNFKYSGQKGASILMDCTKEENMKDMFMDLERMGNCILKTVPSKDQLSNGNRIATNALSDKNTNRNFATVKSRNSYSRFIKSEQERNASEKEEEVYKQLEEIHDEALENEMFFLRGIERTEEENELKNESEKEKSKVSIYHEIVRKSELNDFESKNSKTTGHGVREKHLKKFMEETENENLISADTNEEQSFAELVINSEFCNEELLGDSSILTTISGSIYENSHPENKMDTFIFNEQESQNATQKFSENNNTTIVEENTMEFFDSTPSLFENPVETVHTKNRTKIKEECFDQEKLRRRKSSQNSDTRHKILKKFAEIRQEPGTSVFEINNELKFDTAKKRMCQIEKGSPKIIENLRKTKPKIDNLTPSEDSCDQTRSRISDADLRKLLLENPKNLMQIAASALSKNQYLNFLLDLRSTKEIKDYWMQKIKERIASSRPFSDLSKVVEFVKSREVVDSKTNPSVGKNEDMRDEKKNYVLRIRESDIPTVKSDGHFTGNKMGLKPEDELQRPKSGQSNKNSGEKNMFGRNSGHDSTSRRNLSFQQKSFMNILKLCPPENSENITEPFSKNQKDINVNGVAIQSNLLLKKCSKEVSLDKQNREGTSCMGKVNFTVDHNTYRKEKAVEECVSEQDPGSECSKVNSSEAGELLEMKNNIRVVSEDKKAQQTAIVLPGRKPIKVSFISGKVSTSPKSSNRDSSDKNALENMSEVLFSCSNPVSSSCCEGFSPVPKRIPTAATSKCSSRSQTSGKTVTFAENISYENGVNLDHLKRYSNRNVQKKSWGTEVKEQRKIRIIRTKSLSEILKDNPDVLKRFKHNRLIDKKRSEEVTKKFEYRFHDFRKKDDNVLEAHAKREEDHKKDIINKFRCIMQAKKVATGRTKRKTKTGENQPKVFSKILDKLSFFKESEISPKNRESTPDVNSVSQTREVPSTFNSGNRRYSHTKKEKINEDELVTLVQKNSITKKVAVGSTVGCEASMSTVIHIPWTATT